MGDEGNSRASTGLEGAAVPRGMLLLSCGTPPGTACPRGCRLPLLASARQHISPPAQPGFSSKGNFLQLEKLKLNLH